MTGHRAGGATPISKPRRTPAKSPARLQRADHARLWRLVEGAVVDAMQQHPDYFTAAGLHDAVQSITKRVVGSIVGDCPEVLRHRSERAFHAADAPTSEGVACAAALLPLKARGPAPARNGGGA